MVSKPSLWLLAVALSVAVALSAGQGERAVGTVTEDSLPVVFNFLAQVPDAETREVFPWLTVVQWKYDGAEQNGMPPAELNERMLALEISIEESLLNEGLCAHAYSRTGNHVKELVYYIRDRDEFLAALNEALAVAPRYPIEITFYEDRLWDDLRAIVELFSESR